MTVLNQGEYSNGQILDDVKLQTINEQLFGDFLPNDLSEPHVNTDAQQDIGNQTNRWREGNFSDRVNLGNNPQPGIGGVLLGTDGPTDGIGMSDGTGSSHRVFRDSNIGYMSRNGTTTASPNFAGVGIDTSGRISHGINNAAPQFIEGYNLNGRLRAYNAPKAYAAFDGRQDTVQVSYGFSSISFGTQQGQGQRNYATLTFDTNATPPNAAEYLILLGSDRILDSSNSYDHAARIFEKNATDCIIQVSSNTNSGNVAYSAEFTSIAIYWEAV